ncbi:MAG: hypothetical protein PF637_02515 [Spirochaetes bacterium]|nr:hypothetical protein [Spirochaetota bacterium]
MYKKMNKQLIRDYDRGRESLNDLLLAYKHFNTYFEIFVNRKDKLLVLVMTDNPKYFTKIPEETLANYRGMKRVEMNVKTLYTAYIAPEHILFAYGSTLGINFPLKQIEVYNNLNIDNQNFYLLKAPIRYLPDVIQAVKKILDMPPQLKYEFVEKFLLDQ